MSTTIEREKNSGAVRGVIAAAANGDAAAARYLEIIAGAARVLDDLVDADHPVPHDQLVLVFYTLLIELQNNPFFNRHREALTMVHVLSLNAWLDANALDQTQTTPRIYAHVLRDTINEIATAAAYLTGGWIALRQHSMNFRNAFMKPLNEDK